MNDPITLENIEEEWIKIVRENASPTIPIVLVGTKLDLVDDQILAEMQARAQAMVQKYGLAGFVATSSKWNINVEETILYMVDLLLWQCFNEEQATGMSYQSSA